MKPSEFAMKQRRKKVEGQPEIGDWFKKPAADEVARKHHVWGLLAWYHHQVVAPRLGIRGAFRMLWWRILSIWKPGYRVRLMSPWEQIHFRLEQQRVMAETAAKNGRPDPVGAPEVVE